MNRRRFLSVSAATAAALPTAMGAAEASLEGALHDEPGPPRQPPSAAETVSLALIGCGGRGTMLIQSFVKHPNVRVAWVCDPEAARMDVVADWLQKNAGQTPKHAADMRRVLDDRDVDAVIIATPEHWHGLATVWACQAGKDVYVEKNASLGIWEGRRMIQAARRHGRIVDVGTQNRSAPYNMAARDYIRSGRLGKVLLVKVFNLQGGGRWSAQPDSAPPPGLDWDLWLGPAPKVPYNPGRHRSWGDYWEYCGGTFSGDGSHQLDLARMVMGDPPPPRLITCSGGRFQYDDGRVMPDLLEITYDYGGWLMTMENGTFSPYMDKIAWDVRDSDLFPYWPQCATRIEIYGTEGLMFLGRHGGGWQVFGKAKSQSRPAEVVAQMPGRFPDVPHQRDFLECVRTRRRPTADIEVAHESANLIHYGVAAYRSGERRLAYDANSETFDRPAANRFLKPHYRKGFEIPDRA